MDAKPPDETVGKKTLKKRARYAAIVEHRKAKRKEEKRRRRQREALRRKSEPSSSDLHRIEVQRARKNAFLDRIASARRRGPKIFIDLSFRHAMTSKERGKLAGQLGRTWGVLKKADRPADVTLCSMEKNEDFFQECCRKNDGFADYSWTVSEQSFEELTKNENVVYLSPDSPNILTKIEAEKIYVIGGLVDETRRKCASLEKARRLQYDSARLPIEETMRRSTGDDSSSATYNKILTINQVVEIVCRFMSGENWPDALAPVLPKRFGFCTPKDACDDMVENDKG